MQLAASPGLFIGLAAALFSAFLFGGGDYKAGELAKKMSPVVFTIIIYLIEIPVLFALVILKGEYGDTSNNIWLLFVGVLGTLSYFSLVTALTKGHMSVVMALVGLLSLVVPAIVSVVVGETSSVLVWVGVAIAAIAIVCITQARKAEGHEDAIEHAKGLKISIILGTFSGIFTGVYFAGLGHIEAPIILKLFLLQVPGFIASCVYCIIERPKIRVSRNSIASIVAVSLAYNLGQLLYPFAADRTSLIVTNIIVNLYPGVTIGLAKLLIHEKTSRMQNIGFFIAALGVIVVSIGAGN